MGLSPVKVLTPPRGPVIATLASAVEKTITKRWRSSRYLAMTALELMLGKLRMDVHRKWLLNEDEAIEESRFKF